ncbi:Uncharacterized protein At2g34460, chloroplastic at C-terminar half [Coccomyxa sp. Obi]|nr:Uncharacterized protein At2g34460, chloroplastic at C-terminar half [Coccomyxa sp. Obi]
MNQILCQGPSVGLSKQLPLRQSSRTQGWRSAACRPQRHNLSARRSHMVRAEAMDPDNASILVAGGGGVALSVTRRLKDMGSWVWMLQRSDSRRQEIEKMMAIVVRGDALNKDDVQKAFDQIEEVDAVVSTLGGTPGDPTADSQGNINLIEAALAKGVKKFVLVTSIGTGDSKDAPPSQVYDVLKPVLLEKEKAEERLKQAGGQVQWTIIRPGGLKNDSPTGSGVLTADKSICGAINREDVAELVVKALFSDKANGKVLSAVDKNQLFGTPKFDVFEL